jgi:hypothetical protein
MLGGTPGGVAEWLKAAVSKTVNGGFVVRGFESLPLRSCRRKACKSFLVMLARVTGRKPHRASCGVTPLSRGLSRGTSLQVRPRRGRRTRSALPRPSSHVRHADGGGRRADVYAEGVARPPRLRHDAGLRRLPAEFARGRSRRRGFQWSHSAGRVCGGRHSVATVRSGRLRGAEAALAAAHDLPNLPLADAFDLTDARGSETRPAIPGSPRDGSDGGWKSIRDPWCLN